MTAMRALEFARSNYAKLHLFSAFKVAALWCRLAYPASPHGYSVMELSKVTAAAINQNEFDLAELARRMHVNAAAVIVAASEPFDESGMDAGRILESTAGKLREAANLVARAAQLLGIAELPPAEPLVFDWPVD
jgi:hypothetical protein